MHVKEAPARSRGRSDNRRDAGRSADPAEERRSRSLGSQARPQRDKGLAPSARIVLDPDNMPADTIAAAGVLDIRPDGAAFLRTRDNWLPDPTDVMVPQNVIRNYQLRHGQMIQGFARPNGRSSALALIQTVEGLDPEAAALLPRFTTLEAEIPYERLRLETTQEQIGPRIIDLLAPLGKGQRGLIVAPPQAGKTRLLRDIATSVTTNHPDTNLFILLIDERPEEVTELRSLRMGQVVASTFDESRVGHLAAAELALERIQRLVEAGKDVFVLMDSLTRLARASNLSIRGTGRSLSGGLDPAALTFPRKLFGAARATRGAGNLTILATALVETGSVMDEFVFQEFKGTGNWEVKLERKLAQRRIFPAIDIAGSGTRREEMLYTPQELSAMTRLRQYLYKFSQTPEARSERLVWLLHKTKSNADLLALVDRL